MNKLRQSILRVNIIHEKKNDLPPRNGKQIWKVCNLEKENEWNIFYKKRQRGNNL